MTEKEREYLLKQYDERMFAIEQKYFKLMGQHIRSLGRLTASDIDRLEAMRRVSKDMNEVQNEIRKQASLSVEELQTIFEKTIRIEGNDFLSNIFKGKNKPANLNRSLNRLLESQAIVTQDALKNFSRTTVVSSNRYINAVDTAIHAVQAGYTDYNTAIRGVIKKAGSEGLRVSYLTRKEIIRQGIKGNAVTYVSGYTRRLDSAARQNILDGMRSVNQESMNLIGRELGTDGVEISAHMLCAEDHLPYQGLQFSNKEFEDIQERQLERPFGQWNCKHFWTPIFLGVSKRTYSDDTLQEYKRFSSEKVTIEAKDEKTTQSRYEWSQEQRRIETAVRQLKGIRILANEVNDLVLVKQTIAREKELKNAYNIISEKAGLVKEPNRMKYGKENR